MSYPAGAHPDTISNIVAYLKTRITEAPDVGIICGSGLGGLAATIPEPRTVIKYEEIDGFPRSTVHGHAGQLVIGKLGGKNVVCMQGRFHYYEGYEPAQVALPVRIFAALGIKVLIATNAAGGVNTDYKVGDVMILNDHVSFLGLAGIHPLRGFNDERFGPRFPAQNDIYRRVLIDQLKDCAKAENFGPGLHEGCYYGLSGPTYESPHEIELVKRCKGDAVGMSTVFEVAVAAHSGVGCVGMSLITNECVGVEDNDKGAPNHEEVLDAVKLTEAHLMRLVTKFVTSLDLSTTDRPKAYHHFVANPPVYKKGGGKCPVGKSSSSSSSSCCSFMNAFSSGGVACIATHALAVIGVAALATRFFSRSRSY